MAFCTKCGKPLTAGQKFCTNCGQKVYVQKTTPSPSPVAKTVAKVASAATSMVRGIDIMASNKKGEWVASSWQPALPTSSTSLVSKVKNFFTPQHKLAYAWFLLPVLTTVVTIVSYIIHSISRLFT